MRLIGERATHIPGAEGQVWVSGLFKNVFEAVVEVPDGQALQLEFVDKFVKTYEDVRYYTFMQISCVFPPSSTTYRCANTMQRLRHIKAQHRNRRNPHLNSLILRSSPLPHPHFLSFLRKTQRHQQKVNLYNLPQKARPRRLARHPAQPSPLPPPTQIPPPHHDPPHRALVHPP